MPPLKQMVLLDSMASLTDFVQPQRGPESRILFGMSIVGSLWVLLLSVAALRTGGLPRALNYLGLVLGVAGTLTMFPALAETMSMVFGTGMILWSVWAGIILLRGSRVAATQQADTYVPRLGTTTLSN